MQEKWWSLVGWWKGWGRVKPLGEAPSLRRQKRPTDVHRNLSFALISRKSEHVALGNEERVWLWWVPILGFLFLWVSSTQVEPVWGSGYVPRAEAAKDGKSRLSCKQKRPLDTERTVLSTGAQRCLRTRRCPFDHLPGAQPGGGRHLDQTPRNFTRVFLTSIRNSYLAKLFWGR